MQNSNINDYINIATQFIRRLMNRGHNIEDLSELFTEASKRLPPKNKDNTVPHQNQQDPHPRSHLDTESTSKDSSKERDSLFFSY